jgi:hypothetical protein
VFGATGGEVARLDHDRCVGYRGVGVVALSSEGTRVATGSGDCYDGLFEPNADPFPIDESTG